jgi:Plavaka transposase
MPRHILLIFLFEAIPCDRNGAYLPPFTPPEPRDDTAPNDWTPFESRIDFDFAHYHFVEAQSSAASINKTLDIWAASVMEFGGSAPWKNSDALYSTIDSIQHGDAPWRTSFIRYQGPQPSGTPPKWMTETYELCVRDARQVLHAQLATTRFDGQINFVPYRQFNRKRQRVWSNLMSADWAWSQAVCTLFA